MGVYIIEVKNTNKTIDETFKYYKSLMHNSGTRNLTQFPSSVFLDNTFFSHTIVLSVQHQIISNNVLLNIYDHATLRFIGSPVDLQLVINRLLAFFSFIYKINYLITTKRAFSTQKIIIQENKLIACLYTASNNCN